MRIIRHIAFILALVLVLTGMSGFVYAEGETEDVGENVYAASSELPEEKTEQITDTLPEEETEEPNEPEIPETEEIPAEEPDGEPVSEEPEEEPLPEESPAEETLSPEVEDTEEEHDPDLLFTEVAAPAEDKLASVSVTWSEGSVAFVVTDAMKWNAEELCWETDSGQNGRIELVEGSNVKTFTVENESEDAFTVSVSFAPDEDLPAALKTAYRSTEYVCDTVPAGGTVNGTATVSFDFEDARLTDDTVTGGTLGSFTIQLVPTAS